MRAVLLVGLAVLSVASLGCPPKRIGKEVVWPPAPDTPRIKFVTSFRSAADLDLSTSASVLRTVLGGDRDIVLQRPMGMALSNDGQRLYVADQTLQQVLVADFAAKTMVEFASQLDVGTPFGVAVDSDDNVYVSDQSGRRVVVFDKAGKQLRIIGAKDAFVRPTGLAIDKKRGLLYVADPATVSAPDHRVLVFTTAGEPVRVMGTGRGAMDGQFHFPIFLDVDAEGRLYVGDTMNFRVQVFEADGRFVRKYGEHGDGVGAFARLKGLAHDGFGNLYAVDGEYAVVQMFNPSFDVLMFFGGRLPLLEYLDLPSGIAIDPATNRIYVANELNPRINVYELINTTATDAKSSP